MAKQMPIVICPYCDKNAQLLMDSSKLYHGRNYGPVWYCACEPAWVGIHDNSKVFMPLGRLANAELRAAKIAAHARFDPLWKGKIKQLEREQYAGNVKQKARGRAYQWLADQMGIPRADCHIGMFNVEQCRQVVQICEPFFLDFKKASPAPELAPTSSKADALPPMGANNHLTA